MSCNECGYDGPKTWIFSPEGSGDHPDEEGGFCPECGAFNPDNVTGG